MHSTRFKTLISPDWRDSDCRIARDPSQADTLMTHSTGAVGSILLNPSNPRVP
jgi:hypothetical protein